MMTRWVQITLTVVFFAAIMLALRAVLHATVPGGIAWLDATIGGGGTSALIIGCLISMAALAYLLYQRDLRKQRLSRRC
ncbi:hypothetical protein [Methylobacterium brachythecii]|uniref:Uncharacterized protein n=1 Tax=Methylobacterium brachythecii TaxID=1176177 RepID=A0A7W6AR24_9HYPH|nr:hypothetical protein [Methylobacterium brachythecii]MBB3905131.1 hypothetical protein [Methylobacterium brachythecii]GLS44361.1 hypothetical protein GCM10007884_23490 [Methylobacterium brachythecii]